MFKKYSFSLGAALRKEALLNKRITERDFFLFSKFIDFKEMLAHSYPVSANAEKQYKTSIINASSTL